MSAVRVFASDAELVAVMQGPGCWLLVVGAGWCGPGRELMGVLAALAPDLRRRVRFGAVDCDQVPAAAVRLLRLTGERGLPLLVLWRDGQMVAARKGHNGRKPLLEWLLAALKRPAGGQTLKPPGG